MTAQQPHFPKVSHCRRAWLTNRTATAVLAVLSVLALCLTGAPAAAQSQRAEVSYQLGSARVNLQEYDKAVVELTEAIRLYPQYAAAYHVRGNAYRGLKQFDKAIAEYTEAIRLKPAPVGYYYRGVVYTMKKENDKALADFDAAVRLNPKFADPYLRRGQIYGTTRQYTKAVADFEKYLSLKPDAPDAERVKKLLDYSKGQAAKP